MKKFDNILICTDLDGTLLKNDKSISQANLDAIEYFKNEGGFFTFITGRPPYIVGDAYEKVKPNVPVVCSNGGAVYDFQNHEYLWKVEISPLCLELVRYIDEKMPDMGIQLNTFDKIYYCKENSAMARFRRLTNSPNLVRHYNDVDEPIAKIIFGDENPQNIETLKNLLDSHPISQNFDFIRSEKTLYEILPKGISKGEGLLKMVQICALDANKTIAVGDYNNDVSMIKNAKIGVAVANAVPEAKAVADHITVSNEEDAIAKIIDDIDKGFLSI